MYAKFIAYLTAAFFIATVILTMFGSAITQWIRGATQITWNLL